MGTPFSTYQQVPYNQQQNQAYTQKKNQQYHNNSFADKQNNQTSQSDATALVEKQQPLLLAHKKSSSPSKQSKGGDTTTRYYVGPQSSHGTTYHTGGPVGVTNCWEYPEHNTNGNEPGTPPTMQGEIKQPPHHGYQRADITYISSQNMASKITHKTPTGANSKYSSTKDCKGQHNPVSRPAETEKTEEPQEQKCHEEILSVHIDDTQKSTYNAKVSGMEATALFDSGATLSCIIHQGLLTQMQDQLS